jgi:hypothetical protein
LGQESRSGARLGRAGKLFGAAALLLAAGAGALALWRGAQDRRFLRTGPARWIWYTRELPQPAPLRFRVWKDVTLEGAAPEAAPILLFVDRDWSLEINGAEVARGTGKPSDPLFAADAARWLRAGENRVAISAGSADGVGGILFRMDLPGGRTVVSDGSWRAERLSPPSEGERAAVEWGRPPIYPWRYPEKR